MGLVTDTRFLIGVAVGFFVIPYATKWVRMGVMQVRGESAAQPA